MRWGLTGVVDTAEAWLSVQLCELCDGHLLVLSTSVVRSEFEFGNSGLVCHMCYFKNSIGNEEPSFFDRLHCFHKDQNLRAYHARALGRNRIGRS